MSTPDHTPSSRRTPYQKFSDKVFSLTGMPVSRVLTFIAGLLVLGGAVLYATREEEQASNYKSQISKKKDYLEAITIPNGFFESAFPIQIEKLDGMIERCDQLLSEKSEYSEYSDKVQAKRLTLVALKAIAIADNGLDPTPTLDLFQENVEQISGSSTQPDEYQYLVVSTYMKVLSADPDLDFYTQAVAAISAIQKTTPVPGLQAKITYESARKYYDDSKDKVKSGKLVQLLGEKMAMAKEPDVSDFGSSLVDYPNFFSSYKGSISQSKLGNKLHIETKRLLKQIEETPPQSLQTYDVLMNVPEQYLHAGNKKVALMVLNQLTSVASSSNPRLRDLVLPKLLRLKTRIDLLNSPFPLSGLDLAGKTIALSEDEQTMIVFFNPNDEKDSVAALRRVAESPLREGWSTTTYLASVEELEDEIIVAIKVLDPNFIFVDHATSKDWLEKSGIDKLPYLIRLDNAGVVQNLSFP